MCMTEICGKFQSWKWRRSNSKPILGSVLTVTSTNLLRQESPLVASTRALPTVGFFHAVLSTLAVTVNRVLRVIGLGRHKQGDRAV